MSRRSEAAAAEAATIAGDRYAEQVAVAMLASRSALDAWSELDTRNIGRSWLQLVFRRLIGPVYTAQLTVARGAQPYVERVTEAYNRIRRRRIPTPTNHVEPTRLAGIASDGRELQTLLYQPAITTLRAIDRGASVRDATAVGATQLDMIVRTQVADAGRAATQVEIAATQTLGYVRMLNPPSCSRCVLLAGRFYRWNDGFERHPRCDCIHIPATEDVADDLRTSPRAYFDSLSEADQNRVFTGAGAQAIRDGANIGQVVNARSGMNAAGRTETRVRDDGQVVNVHTRRLATQRVMGRDVFTTTTGTRRRGGRRVRLMPEQIYLEAAGDRAEAIRLLRLHGYLR